MRHSIISNEYYEFDKAAEERANNEIIGGEMKNEKHTPGPWVIGNNYDENSESFVIRSDDIDGQALGEVYVDHIGQTLEESKANAALIAAAPELLEALNRYVELYKLFDSDRENPHIDYWFDCEDKAICAIAKAEGKA